MVRFHARISMRTVRIAYRGGRRGIESEVVLFNMTVVTRFAAMTNGIARFRHRGMRGVVGVRPGGRDAQAGAGLRMFPDGTARSPDRSGLHPSHAEPGTRGYAASISRKAPSEARHQSAARARVACSGKPWRAACF